MIFYGVMSFECVTQIKNLYRSDVYLYKKSALQKQGANTL